MKTIDLKAILESKFDENQFMDWEKDEIVKTMQEACRYVLDLAAEEATVTHFSNCEKLCFNSLCQHHNMCMSTSITIDKESILKIKERL